MLTIHAVPTLREPVLICAFGGWSDAAFAGSTAVHYLAAKHDAQPMAEFDADQIFSYTVTRPVTSFAASGQRVLRWPQLEFSAVRLPGAAHDFVLLRGPEPDLRWQACSSEAVDFALHIGVSQIVALGAFYAAVPYFGEPVIIGLSPNAGQRVRLTMAGIGETAYEGPTGFLTALVHTAHKKGLPASAIWTAAPSYLPNTNNPKLPAALLGAAERLLGQRIERSELEAAGREMEKQIENALKDRPDLAEFIQKLGTADEEPGSEPRSAGASGTSEPPEKTTEETAEAKPADDPGELPSAAEVLRDLEDYLRDIRRRPPEGQ